MDIEHRKLKLGQRVAGAHDIERTIDLLLARVDQGDEKPQREAVAPNRFAPKYPLPNSNA